MRLHHKSRHKSLQMVFSNLIPTLLQSHSYARQGVYKKIIFIDIMMYCFIIKILTYGTFLKREFIFTGTIVLRQPLLQQQPQLGLDPFLTLYRCLLFDQTQHRHLEPT